MQSLSLQQDNAPAHTARKTKSFFQGLGIHVLDWPANSPDLNPIENAWSVLKRNVEDRQPGNVEELEAVAREEWSKLPKSLFENLIDSMTRRIGQVLERNGGKADY